MSDVVFAGPSLLAEDYVDPNISFRPPAAQGDILRAMDGGARVIGLIDGFFETVLSVSHKEILEAMSVGIPVYGAASMGALRAAELATFGMIGVGEIFNAYRDGRLQEDDAVAVLHGPEALGYPGLSIARVDVDATVDELSRRDLVSEVLAERIRYATRNLHYKYRDWSTILDMIGLAGEEHALLLSLLRQKRVERKRLDAIALLARMRADRSLGPLLPSASFAPPLTPAYGRIRERARARTL